jgi:RNA polymerase sigma-70 factor (ECF subfamily)
LPDDIPRGRARFATTRWSLILSAGQSSGDRAQEAEDALAGLCETYWHPVYAVIRRQGYGADDALDLTQEFFARVIEKNYFKAADPSRGRFRGFLATSVRHFLSNERDRAHAAKRGGYRQPVSLDVQTAEGWYQLEGRDDLTPEKLFDRSWTLVVMDRALSALEAQYRTAGKGRIYDALKGFLTGDSEGTAYAAVGRDLDMSEGAVKVAVHRMRRQFRDRLIEQIAETVSSADEIDAELRHLLASIG